mmetsp:Transcript_17121/g.39360  ORF Transcript_17121/g.39360 Transcript_17121/m.39360 type:complete len:86 (+) Transcript_17121:1886-2143(+)
MPRRCHEFRFFEVLSQGKGYLDRSLSTATAACPAIDGACAEKFGSASTIKFNRCNGTVRKQRPSRKTSLESAPLQAKYYYYFVQK